MSEAWPDMTKNTLGERITYARKRRGMSQEAMADLLGVSRVAVTNWERDVHGIERTRLIPVAQVLRCPIEWLMEGRAIADNATPLIADAATSKLRPLPLVSTLEEVTQITQGIASFENSRSPDTRPSQSMSEGSFAWRVAGDSMEPEFPEGSVIFVDPSLVARSGDYVLARVGDDVTFKQLIVDGDRKYLKPLNSRYPIREADARLEICGVVREMRKLYR